VRVAGGETGDARVEVRVTPPYTVHVGAGTLGALAGLLPLAEAPTHVFVLSDEAVGPLHGAAVAAGLAPFGCPVTVHLVPAGERSKSLSGYGAVLAAMADAGLDRSSLLVALGGGVVGDLGGFAAATYMRGIPVVQAPTSLLAMVDASVGGKTGINLDHGKNLVGAFWQPLAVIADVATLRSLPARERRYGAVELYKAGLLADAAILEAFGTGSAFGAAVDGGGPLLVELIARAIRVKADVVAADPHEHGARATLNLGHTLGHALESLSGHALGHGEAVAYGLLGAAELGARRGLLDWRDQARRLLRWVSPRALPDVTLEALVARLDRDKKRVAGRRRFVLLAAIGQPIVVDDVSDVDIAHALQALQEVGR
jgi:3-dehydroquinate synthase